MNELTALPLLTLLIALPLAGGVMVLFSAGGRAARNLALGCGLLELALALLAIGQLSPTESGFQLVEVHPWIPALNIHYRVGVDGLSALFLPVSALLFVATIIASWNLADRIMPRSYFALLLALEGMTVGIFCALDAVLFFTFWELTLIPVHFLVSLWGVGPNRRHAAAKYTLFMLAGGVPLLFGLLLAALSHRPLPEFDLAALAATPLAEGLQLPVFLLLLVGFGVKIPLVPLHSWLPTLAMEGPVAVLAIMTGLKLGAYGMIRIGLPLAPHFARELHWLLAGVAVVGILYGALAALAQSNLRRMLAYSSISHVGLVNLGIASLTMQGLQGAIFQLLNFAVTTGGLFLLAGFIRQRLGSTDLIHLGGLAKPMPLAASFFLLLGLAGLGIPLTSGFPAELLLLIGVWHTDRGAGLAALGGMILGAGYFLSFYRKLFLGPPGRVVSTATPELLAREVAILILFGGLILMGGVYPAPLLDFTAAAAQRWLQLYGN